MTFIRNPGPKHAWEFGWLPDHIWTRTNLLKPESTNLLIERRSSFKIANNDIESARSPKNTIPNHVLCSIACAPSEFSNVVSRVAHWFELSHAQFWAQSHINDCFVFLIQSMSDFLAAIMVLKFDAGPIYDFHTVASKQESAVPEAFETTRSLDVLGVTRGTCADVHTCTVHVQIAATTDLLRRVIGQRFIVCTSVSMHAVGEAFSAPASDRD